MKNETVLVFDGLADWEIGLIIYKLHTRNEIPVKAAGWTWDPIQPGGGLKILLDLTLDKVDPQTTELLILPGDEMWHSL